VHAGLGGPLSTDCRSDLHQSNLAIFTVFPGTEIGLLVNDAPNQRRIETIDIGLSGNQCIIAVNPILVEEVRAENDDEDYEGTSGYGGRSQKGQLSQAGRLRAGWTVLVDGGQATVREPGRDDWTARLDELVDRISG